MENAHAPAAAGDRALDGRAVDDGAVDEGVVDEGAVLAGTPAFEALFAALEHAVPLNDPALLGLLTGSSLASFG